jgi:RimJ/RimL family protein N-acetyltransferase
MGGDGTPNRDGTPRRSALAGRVLWDHHGMTATQDAGEPDGEAWSIGPDVDPLLLERRQALPRKPVAVELTGPRILLRPLRLPEDATPLHRVSDGEPDELGEWRVTAYDPEILVWRYMSGGPFADPAALTAWLGIQDAAPDGRPFAVVDRATGRPVGVVNLMANVPEHLRIELGNIWYGPVVQGSGVNTEATWLLLRHAFGLGYRRVEWKCDSRNRRSRAVATRMGFRFEGIQQQHYIIKGRERDTAWFRILRDEWPLIEPVLAEEVGARR